jgi:hypothetical protein
MDALDRLFSGKRVNKNASTGETERDCRGIHGHDIGQDRRSHMKKRTLHLVLAVSFFIAFAGKSSAFYCGNNLVSEGDTTAEVILKCGQPYWKEEHTEKIIEGVGEGREFRETAVIEEWTYNFGPQDWLYLLKFRNGNLVTIETRGYGYRKDSGLNTCNKGRRLAIGDTTAEVVMKCGEPFDKSVRADEIRETTDKDRERRVSIVVEEWTYNFGPDSWIFLLKFENGKLVEIKTRGYGQ